MWGGRRFVIGFWLSTTVAPRADRRQGPGAIPKLNDAQRQALAAIIESGPNPVIHGVVRWRQKDLDFVGVGGIWHFLGRDDRWQKNESAWISQTLGAAAPSRPR